MSFWSYRASRENFRSVTGCDNAGAYWKFEFFWHILVGFCAAGVAAAVGVAYIGYRLWTEIALEIGYKQKYGSNWQFEFERDHGSLAHIHSRLYFVFFCLLALLVIFLWFARQFLKSHRRRRHHHAG